MTLFSYTFLFRSHYFFEFDSPFFIHEDIEVLRLMGLYHSKLTTMSSASHAQSYKQPGGILSASSHSSSPSGQSYTASPYGTPGYAIDHTSLSYPHLPLSQSASISAHDSHFSVPYRHQGHRPHAHPHEMDMSNLSRYTYDARLSGGGNPC
jgi:Transcription factor DP